MDIEKRRASQKRWYAANRERVLAAKRAQNADSERRERKHVYQRAWYRANRASQLAQSKTRYDADPQAKARYAEERRKVLRAFIRQQKEGKSCLQCGFSDPRALDFHHRDVATKELSLSEALQRAWSIKRLALEIAKCDVLCANCHRIIHADERDDL